MVKWLEEISVAPEESQNFYHFHDNRVLPPGVDQEKAKAEGAILDPPPCLTKLQYCFTHIVPLVRMGIAMCGALSQLSVKGWMHS